jgi:hypothetical protein
MACKEDVAATLAGRLAEAFSEEAFGPDGPELDCDIDEIEEAAVLAARAAFDAVIAQALRLQNQKLPEQLPCPKCERPCPVNFEKRTVRGRLGTAQIQEPLCHCPQCQRDFFPSAGSVAPG